MLAVTAGICAVAAVLAMLVLPRSRPEASAVETEVVLEDGEVSSADSCPGTRR